MPVGVFFDGFSSTAEMLEVCREAEAGRRFEPVVRAAHGLPRRHGLGDRSGERHAKRDARADRDQSLSVAAAAGRHGDRNARRIRARTASFSTCRSATSSTLASPASSRSSRSASCANMSRRCARFGPASRSRRTANCTSCAAPRWYSTKGRQYPIYIASTGPQMLKLAGEIADGVLLSAGLTLGLDRALSRAGAKRRARQGASESTALRRASFINFRVSHDGAAAKRAMLQQARLPVPQPRARRQHQVVQPRHRPCGDHRRPCPPRLRRRGAAPAGDGRQRVRRPPARPPNAGTAWSSIWRSASTNRSSR